MQYSDIKNKYVYRCSFYLLPGMEEEAFNECLEFWKKNSWGHWRILFSVFRSGDNSYMDLEIEFEDFNEFMNKFNEIFDNSETKKFLDEFGMKYEKQRAGNEVFKVMVEGNGSSKKQ